MKGARSIKTQPGLEPQILQIPCVLLQEKDSKGWAGGARVLKGIGAISIDTLMQSQRQRDGCSAPLRQAESVQLH